MTEGLRAVVEPRVRGYARGDRDGIQALFRSVFGRERSDEAWTWRFQDAPEGPAVIHVIEEDGAIVGHMAHVGFRSFADGRRVLVGHGGDTMVAPTRRGGNLMGALVEGFLASDHPFDARINFPTDKAAALMERYGGGSYVGRIPQWVRASSGGSAAGRAGGVMKLAAWGATVGLRAIAAAATRTGVGPAGELGAEHDELAAASARFARLIRIRDADYLRWRWQRQPGARWALLESRHDGRLHGWAVAGVDPSDPSLGRIVDVLALDARTLRSLAIAAARGLEREGCDRVIMDLSDPRSWVRRACMLAGFVPFGQGVNVVTRSLSATVAPIERLDDWYLTRGDTDLA